MVRLEEAESAGAGAARPPPESVRTEVARLEETESAGAGAARRRGSVEAAVLARGDAPGRRQSTPAVVVPRDYNPLVRLSFFQGGSVFFFLNNSAKTTFFN